MEYLTVVQYEFYSVYIGSPTWVSQFFGVMQSFCLVEAECTITLPNRHTIYVLNYMKNTYVLNGVMFISLNNLITWLLCWKISTWQVNSILEFWLIWFINQRAFCNMLCPSCVILRHRPVVSSSVHIATSHRISHRNFILGINVLICI